MSNLARMIRYATLRHGDQVRKKNGRPYVHDHCLKLLQRVVLDPLLAGDEDAHLIIVGHDIVEDCTVNDTDAERNVLLDEICREFGDVVESGILDLTNEYTKARYPDLNRAERKKRELVRLGNIHDQSKFLKLYDRELNLEDALADNDYNTTYAKESRAMANVLARPDNYHVAVRVLNLCDEIVIRARR